MLFPFEKIRVKPGTVLIETVLSRDRLYQPTKKLQNGRDVNRSPLSPRGQNWIIFSLTDCNDTNPLCSIRLAENSVLCYTMGVIFFLNSNFYTHVFLQLRGPQKLEEISKQFRHQYLHSNVKTKMEILSNLWPSQNTLTLKEI